MLVVVFLLRHSFNNIWGNLIVASLSAISMIAVQPVLLDTSKADISAMLSNHEALTGISLLISLEMALLVFWCFLGFAKSQSRLAKILKWHPCLFILPIIWYVQAQAIFFFPGIEFRLIAFISAAFALIILTAGPYMLRLLIPESDIRKELLFIISIIALLLTSIAPAQGTPLFPQTLNPEWGGLLTLLALSAILALFGYLCNRFDLKLLDITQKLSLMRKEKLQSKIIRKP